MQIHFWCFYIFFRIDLVIFLLCFAISIIIRGYILSTFLWFANMRFKSSCLLVFTYSLYHCFETVVQFCLWLHFEFLLTSEVQSKMIFMGHQILSCRVPVVRSFFIFWKTLLSSWNLPYDHLPIYTNITFQQYPKKWPHFVP